MSSRKLNVWKLPVKPVSHWRHPEGGLKLVLHCIWVTLMSQVLTVEVAVPKVKLKVAELVSWLPRSIYTKIKLKSNSECKEKFTEHLRCCPVFLPQMTGDDRPDPVAETTKESVHFASELVSASSSDDVGPTVVKVSKSKRMKQISEEHFCTE